jgi:hypothetical protein
MCSIMHAHETLWFEHLFKPLNMANIIALPSFEPLTIILWIYEYQGIGIKYGPLNM